eukprot:315754-Prymnesium_polylepis.1
MAGTEGGDRGGGRWGARCAKKRAAECMSGASSQNPHKRTHKGRLQWHQLCVRRLRPFQRHARSLHFVSTLLIASFSAVVSVSELTAPLKHPDFCHADFACGSDISGRDIRSPVRHDTPDTTSKGSNCVEGCVRAKASVLGAAAFAEWRFREPLGR